MARRLGVSREDVVAAAVSIGDRDGLDGLTVAAVASEVGCRPPSVYHHVEGLDGLVRALTLVAADHLTTELERAARDAEGRQRLRAVLLAAHRWGVDHPGRFDALRRPVDPGVDPELASARAAVLGPVRDVLAQLGVPSDRRAPLLAALAAAVGGCIAAALDVDGAGTDGSADAAVTAGHELLVRLLLDHVDAVRPAVAP